MIKNACIRSAFILTIRYFPIELSQLWCVIKIWCWFPDIAAVEIEHMVYYIGPLSMFTLNSFISIISIIVNVIFKITWRNYTSKNINVLHIQLYLSPNGDMIYCRWSLEQNDVLYILIAGNLGCDLIWRGWAMLLLGVWEELSHTALCSLSCTGIGVSKMFAHWI